MVAGAAGTKASTCGHTRYSTRLSWRYKQTQLAGQSTSADHDYSSEKYRAFPQHDTPKASGRLPIKLNRENAQYILAGFDVKEEERGHLEDLIISGIVPEEEMKPLYDMALTSAAEDWLLLLQCATAMRNKTVGEHTSVSGTLHSLEKIWAGVETRDSLLGEQVKRKSPEKSGRAAATKKETKQKSPYWGDGEHSEQTDCKTAARAGTQANGGLKRPRNRNKAGSLGAQGSQQASRADHEGESVSLDTCAGVTAEDGVEGFDGRADLGEVATTAASELDKSKAISDFPVQSPVRRAVKSPYFPPSTPSKKLDKDKTPTPTPSTHRRSRPPRGIVSALPVPPLSASRFGLIQEELAHDPFRLLIAVTFLIRTHGTAAIPTFRQVMERYPTPEALAAADSSDIVAMIRHLGLAAVRCAAIHRYARTWTARPPRPDVRFAVKNYPRPGDGRDVKAREAFGAEEELQPLRAPDGAGEEQPLEMRARGRESAWEIGHLTHGPYAIDSWRIFCRDVLLGRAENWTGTGREPGFQPEWMRVLPRDKELRACLRWMWMKEGWEWDPVTGERDVLGKEMRRAVDEGRVLYDDLGQLQIEGGER